MKKYLFIVTCLAAAAVLAAGCGNRAKKAAEAAEKAAVEQAIADSIKAEQQKQDSIVMVKKISELSEDPVFDIVTNLGTIKVKLYSKTPLHRDNFAKLALTGYYDGLLFHRVINGFMIQGGDPLTKDPANAARYGQGGPDYTIPAEFVPEYRHKKGALAAARRGDAANPKKESSGSQFYLVQNEAACAQLDGAYTVFGETISGLDVIDKIAAVETNARDLPVQDVKIKKIEFDKALSQIGE